MRGIALALRNGLPNGKELCFLCFRRRYSALPGACDVLETECKLASHSQ